MTRWQFTLDLLAGGRAELPALRVLASHIHTRMVPADADPGELSEALSISMAEARRRIERAATSGLWTDLTRGRHER